MEQPTVSDNIIDESLEEETYIIPKKQKTIKETHVLELCPIPESINIDILKEEMDKYMNPRIEFYKYSNRSLYVEDEFSEYFIEKSSDGTHLGKGHCKMDVKTKENEGIDATCVIMNKSMSNEKSIIQNFKSSGSNLDILFKEKRDEETVALFMNDYKNKLENVKQDKNLSDLYILAYISTDNDIYIACFKINILRIPFVRSGGFIEKEDCVSIIVDNFIDSNIGKVTLYKSKKRVELRLKKNILKEKDVHKIYTIEN